MSEQNVSTETKRRSGAWYLLPISFSLLGGIIAYFVIKEDDPKKAKNCIYLGIALTVVPLVILIALGAAGLATETMMGF